MQLFGMESGTQLSPLRVSKVWLPAHPAPCVYHAVYKLTIRADAKKRLKVKPVSFAFQVRPYYIYLHLKSPGCKYPDNMLDFRIEEVSDVNIRVLQSVRYRLQWVGESELGRLQAHCALRSPELLLLATMLTGEPLKEADLAVSALCTRASTYKLSPVFLSLTCVFRLTYSRT